MVWCHSWSSELAYRQSLDATAPAGSGDITYTTYKVATTSGKFIWMAAFDSEASGIAAFKVRHAVFCAKWCVGERGEAGDGVRRWA